MKIARVSQNWSVIRKGKGGVEDYSQILNTGRVGKWGNLLVNNGKSNLINLCFIPKHISFVLAELRQSLLDAIQECKSQVSQCKFINWWTMYKGLNITRIELTSRTMFDQQ